MNFDTLRGRGEVIPDVLLSHISPPRLGAGEHHRRLRPGGPTQARP